jgi:D-amino-acid oxidase
MAPKLRVVIVGCGISALSTGVALLEMHSPERLDVRIHGDPAKLLETTSCGCAGLWMPFHIEPKDKVRRWARLTYDRFLRESKRPETGVRLVTAYKFLEGYPSEDCLPDWREDVLDFRVLEEKHSQQTEDITFETEAEKTPEQVPKICFPEGYRYAFSWLTAVVDMPLYLQWLIAEFQRLGGVFESPSDSSKTPSQPLRSLSEAFENNSSPSMATVVVNATGLGARELCGDTQLRPALGVLVRVRYPMPFVLQVSGGRLDDPRYPTYLIPRSESICTCGGTVLFDLNDAERERYLAMSRSADTIPPEMLPPVAQHILKRCQELYPPWREAAANLEVVQVWSGLRPVRLGGVRLELEPWSPANETISESGRWVIHNYGHGGGGVTVSWGCAAAVAELIATIYHSF